MTAPGAERTGFNREWVETLTPISEKDKQTFRIGLWGSPFKTCDHLRGCESPAEWYLDFHGCESVTACSDHKKAWVLEVMEAVQDQWNPTKDGGYRCPNCGELFTVFQNVMKWRAI